MKKACCNCDKGNCLLLDDGDTHTCPQLISFSRITCNYLLKAVLPGDKKLYAELFGGKTKPCLSCGKQFVFTGRNHRYCPDCAEHRKREKAAERQQRKRDKRHVF